MFQNTFLCTTLLSGCTATCVDCQEFANLTAVYFCCFPICFDVSVMQMSPQLDIYIFLSHPFAKFLPSYCHSTAFSSVFVSTHVVSISLLHTYVSFWFLIVFTVFVWYCIMMRKYDIAICNVQFVSLIGIKSTTSALRGVPVEAGFLCNMIAMLGVVIKTLYVPVQLLPVTLSCGWCSYPWAHSHPAVYITLEPFECQLSVLVGTK